MSRSALTFKGLFFNVFFNVFYSNTLHKYFFIYQLLELCLHYLRKLKIFSFFYFDFLLFKNLIRLFSQKETSRFLHYTLGRPYCQIFATVMDKEYNFLSKIFFYLFPFLIGIQVHIIMI